MEIKEFDHHTPIEGTTLFDGEMAMKGYALNKMCFSFNAAEAREEYLADPEAYHDKFKLTAALLLGVALAWAITFLETSAHHAH